MVNFINSARLRDDHIAAKSLFLGVSVMVLPGKTGIRIGRLGKDHPHQSSGIF